MDLALRGLKKALGTPRRLKGPRYSVLFVMCLYTGRLEALTTRAAASSMDLVRDGHGSVPEDAVLAFWKGNVPDKAPTVLDSVSGRGVTKLEKRLVKQFQRRYDIPIPSNVWLTALAHGAGQMGRYLLLEPDDLRPLIMAGHLSVENEDVAWFQMTKNIAGDA